MSTLLARWSDTRFSRRAVLLLGSAAGALGYLGYAFVRIPPGSLAIGSILLGIAGDHLLADLRPGPRAAREVRSCPPKDAPLYMNIFRLFFALAWTVGPGARLPGYVPFSFAGTFAVAALCYAALFFAIFLLVPSRPPARGAEGGQPSRDTARPGPRRSAGPFPGLRDDLRLRIPRLDQPAPPRSSRPSRGTAEERRHSLQRLALLRAAADVPLRLAGLARRSRQALIRLGVLLAVVVLRRRLALSGAPWHIYPLQILSAAITAVTQGVAITFFQDFLPNQVGTATNLYSNASRLGQIAGYVLFSWLAAPLGYRNLFLMNSAICCAAFLLMWLFRPRLRPRPGAWRGTRHAAFRL